MMREALVVHADPKIGKELANHLRSRGFTATILNDGTLVPSWVHEHRPELIVIDEAMPGLNGYQICEKLKLDLNTTCIPTILLTAAGDSNHKPEGYHVRADAFLQKPFTPEQLDFAIEEVRAWHLDLSRNGLEGEIRFHLQSDLRYLDELNKLLSDHFLKCGLSPVEAKQLTMAVRELGANAIEWGNKRQVERIVLMTFRIDPKKVTIVIRDSGPGFNPSKVPHAANEDDPISHMSVREALGLREGGFGIMIVKGLVDQMEYNECGNEVRLVKCLSSKTAKEPAANQSTS